MRCLSFGAWRLGVGPFVNRPLVLGDWRLVVDVFRVLVVGG